MDFCIVSSIIDWLPHSRWIGLFRSQSHRDTPKIYLRHHIWKTSTLLISIFRRVRSLISRVELEWSGSGKGASTFKRCKRCYFLADSTLNLCNHCDLLHPSQPICHYHLQTPGRSHIHQCHINDSSLVLECFSHDRALNEIKSFILLHFHFVGLC